MCRSCSSVVPKLTLPTNTLELMISPFHSRLVGCRAGRPLRGEEISIRQSVVQTSTGTLPSPDWVLRNSLGS
jgi:hypothetical protein